MGTQKVESAAANESMHVFMKQLLNDIKALEQMLNDNMFETNILRIGAEQELCLVDKLWKPAQKNLEVLKKANDPQWTAELAKFNLEINLKPLEFQGNCLSAMEQDILVGLRKLRTFTRELNADVLLAGILPTIRKFDVESDNLTPLPRYKANVEAMNKMRGSVYELRLRGIDELHFTHDSPLLEAANTGFQVHLQIKPIDFVKMYNFSQAIAAPVLALAVNSPMLFGKRLWSETRIALFQQSIDTRAASEHLREQSPRVTFGTHWVKDSILEIYKEDITRFRALLSSIDKENAVQLLKNGQIPRLKALQVHNSTVYRWNRACYGITDGKPHLRIENRVLPSGPTVVDEMANAAFWLGLMNGMSQHYEDITKVMDFDHASANFLGASRHGLDTHFRWVNGKRIAANELIEKELLPIAQTGLENTGISKKDIDRYLGIISERNASGKTGSQWMVDSYSKLIKEGPKDEVIAAITSSMAKNQRRNKPVHKWPLASFTDAKIYDPHAILVEEFMTTDLFTVQKEDILEFVADMLDWRRIRYLPVEDDGGKLVGLISSRILLRHCVRNQLKENGKPITVKELMIKNPMTINPESTITEAMSIMEKHKIGCLPVIKNEKLVGIITEGNYLHITARLLKRYKEKK